MERQIAKCDNKACEFYSERAEQNCDGELCGEPAVASCKKFFPDIGALCECIQDLEAQLTAEREKNKRLLEVLEKIASEDVVDDDVIEMANSGMTWERIYEEIASQALKENTDEVRS